MSRLNKGSNTWVGKTRTFFTPASLQFRLMASVVGIYAIALMTYKALSHWEVQTLLMMQPERLTSIQLIGIADRLTLLSLLFMSIMMIAVLGGIW